MIAGYTYLDGEIVDLTETVTIASVVTPVSRAGNVLPNTPEHSASLWSTYDLPHGFEIGGGLVYSSDRLLNNTNAAVVDGYTRVDATAAYVTERFSVRVNLQNVTDEEYFEVASAGRATPAAGRSVLGTVSWNF
jgi:catecholate siderophore receptor